MTKTQRLAAIPLAAALMLGGGAIVGYAGLASAQTGGQSGTASSTPWGMHKGPGMGMHRGMGPGVMGTISAINGNSVTVTGKDGKTYTVDASSAQIDKIVQLGVGDLKVGDTIGVQGQVSGTSVSAKHIMDGIPPKPQNNAQSQPQTAQ